MNIQTFTRGNIDRGKGAQLFPHQMRMNRPRRKNRRNGHALIIGVVIHQHDMLSPAAHRILGLAFNTIQRFSQRAFPIRRKRRVDGHRFIA